MKVPENLYHYTSIESLLSIINGIDINNEFVKFRSTHIAYLNDMTEGRLLQNALKKNGINEDVIKILETRVRDKDCVKNRVKRAKIVRFTLC